MANEIKIDGVSFYAIQRVMESVYGQKDNWNDITLNQVYDIVNVLYSLGLSKQIDEIFFHLSQMLSNCDNDQKLSWIIDLQFKQLSIVQFIFKSITINQHLTPKFWNCDKISCCSPDIIKILLKLPKLSINGDTIWMVCASVCHNIANNNDYTDWSDAMSQFDDIIDVSDLSATLCINNLYNQPKLIKKLH